MKRKTFVWALLWIGLGMLFIYIKQKDNKVLRAEKEYSEKMVSYYHLFNRWLRKKQFGESVTEYFKNNSIASIAIYGYRELGQRLFDELKETDIKVKYVIDKNVDNVFAEVDTYSPDEEFPHVDAIVVTASYYFDEIEDELYEKVNCPILSLEQII